MSVEPRILAISDGRAGNVRQAEALAAAIGGTVTSLQVQPPPPWRWFAPSVLPGAASWLALRLGPLFNDSAPDLIIGCGRQAALLLRLLKRRWPQAFTVQILDPRRAHAEFDLIICPEHDQRSGPNVLVTIGALHDITPERLQSAKRVHAALDRLPRPITSLLIGGPSPMLPLHPDSLQHLLSRIEHLPGQLQGSLLITTSRRTPPAVLAQLQQQFGKAPGTRLWFPGQTSENPYLGYLACADRIVVTPDSVNMLTEAVAVGVPVYTLCERPPEGKLARFHAALNERGLLHPLGILGWPRPALRETENIAAVVRQRWQAYRASKD